MSRKTVKWVSVVIALVFIFGIVGSLAVEFVYADTAQQKINQAQEKKNKAQQSLNSNQTKRAKTLAEMEKLEKETGDIQGQIVLWLRLC